MLQLKVLVPLAFVAVSQALVDSRCKDAAWDSTTDFWTTKLVPNTQSDETLPFSAVYNTTFVTVSNSNQVRNIVLYCTSEPPPASVIGESALAIKVPVTNVAAIDGLSGNFIDMIGQSASVARVGELNTVTSVCLRGNLNDSITYDEANWVSAPDVDVAFSSSQAAANTSDIVIANDGDLKPLQVASYIKLIGMFYGLDDVADDVYQAIAASYRCAISRVEKGISSGSYTSGKAISPLRLTDTNFAVDQGSWWRSIVADASLKLVAAYEDGATASGDGAEEVLLSASSVSTSIAKDSWAYIDTTQYQYDNISTDRLDLATWLSTTKAPSSIEAVKGSNIFLSDKAFNPALRHNFNDLGPARPDLVLNDLISLIYPGLLTDYTREFLRPVNNSTETSDQRRLSNVCVASGTEVSSLDLGECTISSATESDAPSASSSDSATGSHAKKSGLSIGEIAGIVVGIVVGVSMAAATIVLFGLRKRRNAARSNEFNLGKSMSSSTLGRE
ncbi:hypothetical protein PVAG01_05291 [Phlyctema vagabunda]|uniref:Periplasmic binding protein n=1 Tax=Phlyctema vagabunda TaxID=108571 RepID=A0ABR4PJL7_9HELO